MGKKGMQPYEVDGVLKGFDFDFFRAAFEGMHKKHKEEFNKTQLEESLAKSVNVEPSTVHNWRGRRNSPATLEIVYQIADFLGIRPQELLTDHKEQSMDKLSDSQRKSIANVYRDIEDYLYLYVKSDGFVWRDYKVMEGGPYAKYVATYTDESAWAKRDAMREAGYISDETLQVMIYRATKGHVFKEGADLAEAGYDWVLHSLEREWVELGNHPIYAELEEYLDEALLEIWNDKTDPDYRFEPLDKDDDMSDRSTSLEAARALKGVREIIGKYL